MNIYKESSLVELTLRSIVKYGCLTIHVRQQNSYHTNTKAAAFPRVSSPVDRRQPRVTKLNIKPKETHIYRWRDANQIVLQINSARRLSALDPQQYLIQCNEWQRCSKTQHLHKVERNFAKRRYQADGEYRAR